MQNSDDSFPIVNELSFESLQKHNQHGIEYWSARDLQPCLGYAEWRKFKNAIKKAVESCTRSGNDSNHHFVGAAKPIPGGKGSSSWESFQRSSHLSWGAFKVRMAWYRLKPSIKSVVKDNLTTAADGKRYKTKLYSLKLVEAYHLSKMGISAFPPSCS